MIKYNNSINVIAENEVSPLSEPASHVFHNMGYATNINGGEYQGQLFPNPFIEIIYLEGINKLSNYQIMNTNGKKIISGKLSPNQDSIDLSGLSSGIYFIKVFDLDGHPILSKKIIKI